MKEYRIWYSVRNGGDGSAYPTFMESKELAELDQEWMDEGWGEPCIGYITIKSESPIEVVTHVETLEENIKEIEDELARDYMIKYRKEGKYPVWFKRLEGKLDALKKLKDNQEDGAKKLMKF